MTTGGSGTEKPIAITVKKVYPQPRKPPIGITWAGVSNVGPDVILEVGSADIAALAVDVTQNKVSDGYELQVDVHETFLLTPTAVLTLYQTVSSVYKSLGEAMGLALPGHPPKEEK